MAYTINDYGTASTINNIAAGLNCTWHSGVAPADGAVLLAFVVSNTSSSTAVAPAGWSTLFSFATGTSNYMVWACFYKTASSEPTNYNFALSAALTGRHMCVNMASISGSDNTQTPTYVQNFTTTNAPATGTLTPVTASSLLIAAFGCNSNVTNFSVASGCTLIAGIYDGSGTSSAIMTEYQTALTGSSATSSIASTPTGTILTANTAQVLLVPAPVNIGFSDTAAALSDVLAQPTLSINITISETGPSLSDGVANNFSALLTFTDTATGVSDTLSLQGSQVAIVDTIAALSDSFTFSFSASIVINDSLPQIYDNLSGAVIAGSVNNWFQEYFPFGQS